VALAALAASLSAAAVNSLSRLRGRVGVGDSPRATMLRSGAVAPRTFCHHRCRAPTLPSPASGGGKGKSASVDDFSHRERWHRASGGGCVAALAASRSAAAVSSLSRLRGRVGVGDRRGRPCRDLALWRHALSVTTDAAPPPCPPPQAAPQAGEGREERASKRIRGPRGMGSGSRPERRWLSRRRFVRCRGGRLPSGRRRPRAPARRRRHGRWRRGSC
jgi:hypothetical protein